MAVLAQPELFVMPQIRQPVSKNHASRCAGRIPERREFHPARLQPVLIQNKNPASTMEPTEIVFSCLLGAKLQPHDTVVSPLFQF